MENKQKAVGCAVCANAINDENRPVIICSLTGDAVRPAYYCNSFTPKLFVHPESEVPNG